MPPPLCSWPRLLRTPFQVILILWSLGCLSAASHEVTAGLPLVIPIIEVIGGTAPSNNAKHSSAGGYCSSLDSVSQFNYPATHGNQLGDTALVNDHVYWDSSPGGLDATHAPHGDPGGGPALWWPIPGEWTSYAFTVTEAGPYAVAYRFSSGWGPGQPVVIHISIDGMASGPVTMKPDDAQLWADTHYQVAGWWGHTMVTGTCPVAWSLKPGPHVVKFFLDSFPEHPTDHGNVWIHYLEILGGPAARTHTTKVLIPVIPARVQPSQAAFTEAQSEAAQGRMGSALTAYKKAAAAGPSAGGICILAAARATVLQQRGHARLAAAQALPDAQAMPLLAQISKDYGGSDIGDLASKALRAAAAGIATAGWVPPDKVAATTAIRALVLASVAKGSMPASLRLFGHLQQVTVTGADAKTLSVQIDGSGAGLEVPWTMLCDGDLARLGLALIHGQANKALVVGDFCARQDLADLARQAYNQAKVSDPAQRQSMTRRYAYLQTLSPR